MRCPQCKQRAISFASWALGNRWLLYRCPHCNTLLTVSGRTIKVVIITFILGFPVAALLVFPILDHLQIENDGTQRLLGTSMIAILLAPSAFWEWKTGSYAIKRPKKTESGSE